MAIWDFLNKRFGRSKLQELITQGKTNVPVYPDTTKAKFYLDSYTQNGDVFSIINKITEPASRVPIEHINIKTGKPVQGSKTLELLKRPNPFQSQTEFIESCLTFFNVFGDMYVAGEKPEFGLRTDRVIRLDVLPTQWVEIMIGTFKQPIKGYALTEAYEQDILYEFEQVLHWKEFNPDFSIDGKHLYGMSRLKPLISQITASQSGYDSMVAEFQNGGAQGILTILGVKGDDGKYTDRPETVQQMDRVVSKWKQKWTGNAKRGDIAHTNKEVKWTPFGLSVQDMSILASLPISRGVIADAYNVPDVLLSGSEGRTFDNYGEAMKALWNNAIIPNLDGLLNKFNDWLIPLMGEEGTMLKANYDDISALQADKGKMVDWMVRAGFTGNMIWEALGYEPSTLPNMDIPLVSMGMQRIDEIGMMPEMGMSEDALKRLGIEDYRENKA